MVELIRPTDLVHLSWAQAMLEEEGIAFLLVDLHTSSVEGGIGALARRLVVAQEQIMHAHRSLDEAAREMAVDDDARLTHRRPAAGRPLPPAPAAPGLPG